MITIIKKENYKIGAIISKEKWKKVTEKFGLWDKSQTLKNNLQIISKFNEKIFKLCYNLYEIFKKLKVYW